MDKDSESEVRDSAPSTQSSALSVRAAHVIDVAHELARRDRSVEPHSGHVLIGLLRMGGGVVEDTFGRLGIGYEDALGAVDDAERAQPASAGELTDLLVAAREAAERGGQVMVAAADLLLGTVADQRTIAARALTSMGIDRAELARVVWANRDMLVPLLALPNPAPAIERAAAAGVTIRRARAWEAPALAAFIAAQGFWAGWVAESANAFARQPQSVFLALRDDAIAGFAAYDCGLRGIFGPTGVAREGRRSGVASALLLRTLSDMRSIGYAYAIIGAVGPAEFYERVCGAVLLPSAWPSYVDWNG